MRSISFMSEGFFDGNALTILTFKTVRFWIISFVVIAFLGIILNLFFSNIISLMFVAFAPLSIFFVRESEGSFLANFPHEALKAFGFEVAALAFSTVGLFASYYLGRNFPDVTIMYCLFGLLFLSSAICVFRIFTGRDQKKERRAGDENWYSNHLQKRKNYFITEFLVIFFSLLIFVFSVSTE